MEVAEAGTFLMCQFIDTQIGMAYVRPAGSSATNPAESDPIEMPLRSIEISRDPNPGPR